MLDPDIEGRRLVANSWAYPPQISELADLPLTARRLMPWLHWDPARVYAIGNSMGGQEALMLLVHRPDAFAGVVASDAAVDFLRRWYEFPRSRMSKYQQANATREVGATPTQVPWLYRRRSPAEFARTIAFSGVAVQLWWNPNDRVVINQATTQTGRLHRLLRRLNPQAPIVGLVHDAPHGFVFHYDHSLPAMIGFLLAHRRVPPPPAGFSYASWLPGASIWGWRVRSGNVGHGLWRLDRVRRSGFESRSPTWLRVRPPFQLLAALLDGQPLRLRKGWVLLPPGRHRVQLLRLDIPPLPL